ncbi:MAG: serine protease [Sedimentisphaerales bacterium]
MVEFNWALALDKLRCYIFKILTPNGSGTGFLISLSGNVCGVATALHVIEHASEWEEPIKLQYHKTNKQILLKNQDRVIYPYPDSDLAFILFSQGEFDLPAKMLKMKPSGRYVREGIQLGWCGFPCIAPSNLCFFTGHVSAYLEKEGSYLVDGVAINGVSGGPAFLLQPRDLDLHLCGVVSAYIANRATGETLPGVCLIRDVAPYQVLLAKLGSLDEAEKAKEEVGKAPSPEPHEPIEKSNDKKKEVDDAANKANSEKS